MRKHRPVHARRGPASELVPIVARKLELGLRRQLDLREGKQIVEASFSGDLLAEKPLHLAHRGLFSEPRKKNVTLAGADGLQILEPFDELARIAGSFPCAVHDVGALFLDETNFIRPRYKLFLKTRMPIVCGQPRREALRVKAVELKVKTCVSLHERVALQRPNQRYFYGISALSGSNRCRIFRHMDLARDQLLQMNYTSWEFCLRRLLRRIMNSPSTVRWTKEPVRR